MTAAPCRPAPRGRRVCTKAGPTASSAWLCCVAEQRLTSTSLGGVSGLRSGQHKYVAWTAQYCGVRRCDGSGRARVTAGPTDLSVQESGDTYIEYSGVRCGPRLRDGGRRHGDGVVADGKARRRKRPHRDGERSIALTASAQAGVMSGDSPGLSGQLGGVMVRGGGGQAWCCGARGPRGRPRDVGRIACDQGSFPVGNGPRRRNHAGVLPDRRVYGCLMPVRRAGAAREGGGR